MALELKDARITVKIDLGDSEQTLEGVEKRREEARREDRDDERKKRKEGREKIKRGVGSFRSLLLFQVLTGVLRSLPLGIGAGFAVGIGAAELNERFGPFIDGLIEKWFEKQPADDFSNKVAEKLGIDPPTFSDISKNWSEVKAKLASISTGFDGALSRAAGDILSGGTVPLDEFSDIFAEERRFAEFKILLQKLQRRQQLRLLGKGTLESVRESLGKEVGDLSQ